MELGCRIGGRENVMSIVTSTTRCWPLADTPPPDEMNAPLVLPLFVFVAFVAAAVIDQRVPFPPVGTVARSTQHVAVLDEICVDGRRQQIAGVALVAVLAVYGCVFIVVWEVFVIAGRGVAFDTVEVGVVAFGEKSDENPDRAPVLGEHFLVFVTIETALVVRLGQKVGCV
jgi:hypothetical protein